MKEHELLDAVGGIEPEYVRSADRPAAKKGRAARWIAAAACLCIVAAGAFGAARLGLFGASGGSGGSSGITYMSYAGPVFPLTAAEPDPDISATRHIDFDFSPYETRTKTIAGSGGEEKTYETYSSECVVTDGYELTNRSAEDKTLTLLYPFAASLGSGADERPSVSVDGAPVGTALHVGPYAGAFTGAYGARADGSTVNLAPPASWEDYKALVEAGYQASAFDELPDPDLPVVVYELRDRYGEKSDTAPAPTLNMEFYIDFGRTTVLTYGFNRSEDKIETGRCARGTHVPEPRSPDYGESAYLIVLGDDIGDYELKAYTNGGCRTELENAGASVVRCESSLRDVLAEIAELYLRDSDPVLFGEDDDVIRADVSRQEYLGLVAEMLCDLGPLSDDPKDRYSGGMLEDFFSEVRSVKRVMYLEFTAKVPAGGSVTVETRAVKPASEDFVGKDISRNGYDMVTSLGSVLSFEGQSASLSNTEHIEVIRQNFGFDLPAGKTEVELDPAEPHYYIEVRKKAR